MHTSADHQHARLQVTSSHRLIAVGVGAGVGDFHGLRFKRHAGFVQYPNSAGLAIATQCAGRQFDAGIPCKLPKPLDSAYTVASSGGGTAVPLNAS